MSNELNVGENSLKSNNIVEFTGNIASTNTTTGTLVVTGGVGLSGNLTSNSIVVSGSINATSTGTGAIVISNGGIGVSGSLYADKGVLTGSVDSTSTTTGTLVVSGGIGANNIFVGQSDSGNIRITSNTISSTNTDGDINLTPDGLGKAKINNEEIAVKSYVDSVAIGLNFHPSCAVATTDAIAAVYYNGPSNDGVLATLTLGPPLTTLDNYSLQNNDRIMVKNQATSAHNGIYTWATGGTVLTRSYDANTVSFLHGGDYVFIEKGDLYGKTAWIQTNNVTIMGVSDILWRQFSGAGTYTALNGLSLDGNAFSANLKSNGGVTIESGKLAVNLSASNITGTLNVADGGTGATSLTGYVKGHGSGAFTASSTIPATDISGSINNVAVGFSGPDTGSFTTLSANSNVIFSANLASVGTQSGTLVVTGGVGVSGTINAATATFNNPLGVSSGGTGASSLTGYIIGNGTGAMTATASLIGGYITGNIDNVPIGVNVRAAGNFTRISANANVLSTNTSTGTLIVTGDIRNNGTIYATSAILSNALGATSGGTGVSSYAIGDILYSSSLNTLSKLSGNTTSTKKFLTQTGTGSASAAPSWATISASDISGLAGAIDSGIPEFSPGNGISLNYTTSTNILLITNTIGAPNSVAITGGSINGTTIGASTRSTGAFTTITANAGTSSTSTGTGTLVVTGGVGISGALYANSGNFSNPVTVSNGGTGASTLTGYVKGSGTSVMTASPTVPVADITGFGTSLTNGSGIIFSYNTGTDTLSILNDLGPKSAVTITGGSITGTTISGSTGSFTTLAASGVVTLTSTATSTNTTTGALVVTGGVGIAGAVNIGGVTTLTSTATSTNTTTGSIVVSGGVGIAGAANIGGITKVTSTATSTNTTTGALVVTGGVGIGENLNVSGITKITSTATSTSTATGAIVVSGGLGVGGAIYAGSINTSSITSSVTMSAGITSTSTATGTLIVTGGVGVSGSIYTSSIKLSGATSGTISLAAPSTVSSVNYTLPADGTSGQYLKTNGSGVLSWGTVSSGYDGSNVAISGGSINGTTIGSSTRATGSFTTLSANGQATFSSGASSTSTTTGALVVSGGVGISGKLYVGDVSSSISTTTGALIVSGGIGVGGNIHGTTATLASNTVSTSTTTGALIVGGGVGVVGDMNIGGAVKVGGYPAFMCRAWINFNSKSSQIFASANISSITKNGTGDFTINFTNAMPDIYYCMSGNGGGGIGPFDSPVIGQAILPTTTSTRIYISSPSSNIAAYYVGGSGFNSGTDYGIISLAFFR